MEEGNIGRRIRATPEEWAQFGNAVATAGVGDRSKVTRALWLLYQEQPSVRRAVATLLEDDTPVPTQNPDAGGLREKVADLCAYGQGAGLSREDAVETVMTWLRWYAGQDIPWDLATIEMALLTRSLGQEWQPA